MKIKLFNSDKYTVIDDDDYAKVKDLRWRLSSSGYAVVGTRRQGIYKVTHLHRLIASTPSDKITDHINRDKLDNRTSNLRCVDRSVNGVNVGLTQQNKSGFKGVHWRKRSECWEATLHFRGKHYQHSGFKDIEDAIKARAAMEAVCLTK